MSKGNLVLIGICLTVLSGCPGINIEAASKCHELADLGCTLTASCDRGNKYACIAGFNASVGGQLGASCQDATRVRSAEDFEACTNGLKQQLTSATCNAARPAECSGVIIFE